jgi:CRISPR/Cas system-associated endoribonuclease Cas2
MFRRDEKIRTLKKELVYLKQELNRLQLKVLEMELDKQDILKLQNDLIRRLNDQHTSEILTISKSNKKQEGT